ncbi:MAG TPA: hypothetical protein VK469_07580, partial [Candidatus Kapabacteria bacterium]|nr:hypothetical protein [Candidatus Kapabacteria bacterium]
KRALQLLTVMVLVLTATFMEALIWVNDIGRSLVDGASEPCENMVTAGADLYFKANADIMTLFAETEMAPGEEYNYSKALTSVQASLGYLNEAKTNYVQAAQLATSAGYIQSEIDLLKNYDYDTLAVAQGLNNNIKEKVKVFLKNGDVAGYYQEIAVRLEDVMTTLKVLEKNLQEKTKPQIAVVWEAVQKISDLTLFGNYGTVMSMAAFSKS